MDEKAKAEQLIEKVVESSNRLIREVTRFRADVRNLHGRIQPFDDEKLSDYHPAEPNRIKTLNGAFNAIEESRNGLRNAEYDLNYIRGQIEQLMVDGWSRDDMKKWLK